jgi:hypothetical protein
LTVTQRQVMLVRGSASNGAIEGVLITFIFLYVRARGCCAFASLKHIIIFLCGQLASSLMPPWQARNLAKPAHHLIIYFT